MTEHPKTHLCVTRSLFQVPSVITTIPTRHVSCLTHIHTSRRFPRGRCRPGDGVRRRTLNTYSNPEPLLVFEVTLSSSELGLIGRTPRPDRELCVVPGRWTGRIGDDFGSRLFTSHRETPVVWSRLSNCTIDGTTGILRSDSRPWDPHGPKVPTVSVVHFTPMTPTVGRTPTVPGFQWRKRSGDRDTGTPRIPGGATVSTTTLGHTGPWTLLTQGTSCLPRDSETRCLILVRVHRHPGTRPEVTLRVRGRVHPVSS